FVFKTDLIWIERERRGAGEVMHHVQNARIEPRRFTIAKRVIQIEAAFHALEKREPFEVADRNAVLVDHHGMIAAQRKTPLRRHSHDEDFDAAAQLRSINVIRIAVRETVKLAITNRRGVARHIERFLALLW